MTSPTKDDLLMKVQDQDLVPFEDIWTYDIATMSTQAAAAVLAEHWETAFREGWKLDGFVDDVDRVIHSLMAWRRAVVSQYKKEIGYGDHIFSVPHLPAIFSLDEYGEADGVVLRFCSVFCLDNAVMQNPSFLGDDYKIGKDNGAIPDEVCTMCGKILVGVHYE